MYNRTGPGSGIPWSVLSLGSGWLLRTIKPHVSREATEMRTVKDL